MLRWTSDFRPFLSPSLAVPAKARTAAIVEVSALLAFAGSQTGTFGATGAECHATGCRSCTQPSAEPSENQHHRAIKTAMRWTGASERTVKYWFAGERGPSGEHLILLTRHSDAIVLVLLALAERWIKDDD